LFNGFVLSCTSFMLIDSLGAKFSTATKIQVFLPKHVHANQHVHGWLKLINQICCFI
jgi:hypothetical protein